MLACAHEPLPAVPHTRPRGHAPGPLRARPVRVEPGGGAARVVAARPPAAWLRRAMPPALPSPRRLPVAGDRQRDRPAAGAAGLPRRLHRLVRLAQEVALSLRDYLVRPAASGAIPAVVAQARRERGLPDRRRTPRGRAAAEPPLGRAG